MRGCERPVEAVRCLSQDGRLNRSVRPPIHGRSCWPAIDTLLPSTCCRPRPALQRFLTRCSKFTHEGGTEAPPALPEPAEFAAGVENAYSLCQEGGRASESDRGAAQARRPCGLVLLERRVLVGVVRLNVVKDELVRSSHEFYVNRFQLISARLLEGDESFEVHSLILRNDTAA